MKYGIAIEPKDKEYCGKCRYILSTVERMERNTFNISFLHRKKCGLFNQGIDTTSWDSMEIQQPKRCTLCKKIIDNLQKFNRNEKK